MYYSNAGTIGYLHPCTTSFPAFCLQPVHLRKLEDADCSGHGTVSPDGECECEIGFVKLFHSTVVTMDTIALLNVQDSFQMMRAVHLNVMAMEIV